MNFHVTPPHVAFEEVKRQAESLGVKATGSEIVGLTPREALLVAGRFYAPGEKSEDSLVEAAVRSLGLSQLEPFDIQKKVIEAQL